MSEQNLIVGFVKQGRDLSTSEGQKLLHESDPASISEAVKDYDTGQALYMALQRSDDPYLRRRLILALSQ